MHLSKKAIYRLSEQKAQGDADYAREFSRAHRWLKPTLKEMSTDQIVERLRSFGIPFDSKTFEIDLRRLGSAERVSDLWWDRHAINAKGSDEDFPWLAALALHERLFPDFVSAETLDDWMQEGYALVEEKRVIEACELWLKVWEHIRKIVGSGSHLTDVADKFICGLQSVFNWCQDFEMELYNAGVQDPAFHEKRIRYCQEFCRTFSAQNDLIPSFLRHEAESLFALGRIQEGEEHYEELIRRFPKRGWSYVGWAGEYWQWVKGDMRKDYAKAESILKRALEQSGLEDIKIVRQNLVELYKEWKPTRQEETK